MQYKSNSPNQHFYCPDDLLAVSTSCHTLPFLRVRRGTCLYAQLVSAVERQQALPAIHCPSYAYDAAYACMHS